MRNPLHRRKTAIGDVAGKARAFVAEQRLADRRVNSIRADENIAFDGRPVLEVHADTALGLSSTDATPSRLQDARWQRVAEH